LVLDDSPARHSAFARIYAEAERVHVRSVREACEALDGRFFDVVTLDHDLGDFDGAEKIDNGYGGTVELTGQDVARHIARMAPWRQPGTVVVHSWNPDGMRAMRAILRDGGVVAICQPFGDLPDEQQGPVELVT
jgi:CheY-like chemotaxis protein